MEKDLNIRRRCHVNTNEEGDRFVGIKADSDNASVYFPLGYQLPDDDAQLRVDIKHLIQVLAEFTNKQERVFVLNKFGEPQNVEFPIHAYMTVINYYLRKGGQYYIETEPTYITSSKGNAHWPKTFKNQTPLVQTWNGVSSLVYTEFTVRSAAPNDRKTITQINRFCVYEGFKKLGWLYTSYMPEQPGLHPDIRASIIFLNDKLTCTNNDNDKRLFQAMKDMLEYIDEKTSERQFYFGTNNFENVWERLIDKIFGEKNKQDYFPRTHWTMRYGRSKGKGMHPLEPDTIMIFNGKFYVLDAKYYRYGVTGMTYHLPDSSSINKQITYAEYIEKQRGLDNDSLFNAFLMPYNMKKNLFGFNTMFANVGEAVGEWKDNIDGQNYLHIQGIVIDTRQLMYSYVGKTEKLKEKLAHSIEEYLIGMSVLV